MRSKLNIFSNASRTFSLTLPFSVPIAISARRVRRARIIVAARSCFSANRLNLLKGCGDIPLHCVGTTFLFLLIVVRVFKVLKVIRVLIVLIVIIVIIVINDSIVRIVLVGWISGGAIDEPSSWSPGAGWREWCLLDLVEVEDVADPCQNPFSVGNLFPFGIPVAVGNLFVSLSFCVITI